MIFQIKAERGENMERIKQNLIRDVTKEIPKLPRENQMYLLGIMQGMLMAGEKQEQQKGS